MVSFNREKGKLCASKKKSSRAAALHLRIAFRTEPSSAASESEFKLISPRRLTKESLVAFKWDKISSFDRAAEGVAENEAKEALEAGAISPETSRVDRRTLKVLKQS